MEFIRQEGRKGYDYLLHAGYVLLMDIYLKIQKYKDNTGRYWRVLETKKASFRITPKLA